MQPRELIHLDVSDQGYLMYTKGVHFPQGFVHLYSGRCRRPLIHGTFHKCQIYNMLLKSKQLSMGHFSFKFVSLIIMLFLILQTEVVLKFWANGFSVDDGPLRAIDDPANEQFLDSVKRG